MISYILMIAVGVIGSNSLLLSPILADVAVDFSTSPVEVAWAITTYNASTALSALLFARFIDEWGIYRALLIAFLFVATGAAVSGIAWGLPVLLVGQFLAGLGAGVSLPAIYALAPIIAPTGQETKIVGRVLTGWSLALVAGVPIASFLTEIFGWRTSYYLLFGLSLFILATIAATSRSFSMPVTPKDSTRQAGWSIFSPFSISHAKSLLFMNFLYMTAFYGSYGYVGTYLRAAFSSTTTEAGYSVLAYGVGFGLASVADPMVDKVGVRRASPYIFVLLLIVYLSLAASNDSIITVYTICLVWGFFNHLGLSAIITMIGELKTSIKGQLMGMNSVFTYVGGSVGTIVFGILYEKLSFSYVAFAAALAVGLLTLIFLSLGRNP